MAQEQHTFETTVTRQAKLPYLLYLPPGYDGEQEFPFILFLHGAGERGNDFALLETQGLPKMLAQGDDLPFVVVSPQCPIDESWFDYSEALIALVDEIVAHYAIDPTRVYLTGLSMGGYGTWDVARQYPDRFAAIVPICGGTKMLVDVNRMAQAIKSIPVWVFHGGADPTVPVERSREIVEALKAVEADVKLTVYPGVGHDSWTRTYASPELYDWFLQHHLK